MLSIRVRKRSECYVDVPQNCINIHWEAGHHNTEKPNVGFRALFTFVWQNKLLFFLGTNAWCTYTNANVWFINILRNFCTCILFYLSLVWNTPSGPIYSEISLLDLSILRWRPAPRKFSASFFGNNIYKLRDLQTGVSRQCDDDLPTRFHTHNYTDNFFKKGFTHRATLRNVFSIAYLSVN